MNIESRTRQAMMLGTALSVGAALCNAATATDRVWIDGLPPGNGDGVSYTDPNNWLPSGVPGPGDRALFDGLGGLARWNVCETVADELAVLDDTSVTLRDACLAEFGTIRVGSTAASALLVTQGGEIDVTRFVVGNDASVISNSIVELDYGDITVGQFDIAYGDRAFVQQNQGADARVFFQKLRVGVARPSGGLADGHLVVGSMFTGDNPGTVRVAENAAITLVEYTGVLRAEEVVVDGGHIKVDSEAVLSIADTLRIGGASTVPSVVEMWGDIVRRDGALPHITIDGAGDSRLWLRTNVADVEAAAIDVVRGALELTNVGSEIIVPTDGTITVGAEGVLRLTSGGRVTCGGLHFAPEGELDFRRGLIEVNGAGGMIAPPLLVLGGGGAPGAVWLQLDDGTNGSFQTLHVGAVTEHGEFGELRVDGSSLAADTLRVGPTGYGKLTVIGAGATLDADVLEFAGFGTAFVDVTDGAVVATPGDLLVASTSPTGTGDLDVSSAADGADARVTIGGDLLAGANASGSNTGAADITITDGGRITVGGRTLVGADDTIIIDGGRLETTSLDVRNLDASGFRVDKGHVVVTAGTVDLASGVLDADAANANDLTAWTLGGASAFLDSIDVGALKRGSVTLVDGATVSANEANVGGIGVGTLAVNASTLFIEGLRLGANSGDGTLTIDGGSVFVGDFAGVGSAQGQGRLALTNGGTLEAPEMDVRGSSTLAVDDTTLVDVGHGLVVSGALEVTITGATPLHANALVQNGNPVPVVTLLDVRLADGVIPEVGAEWTVLEGAGGVAGVQNAILPEIFFRTLVVRETATTIGVRVVPLIPGDVDANGDVSFSDILEILGAWGPCPPRPAACGPDLDASGAVDFADILIVLGNWS